MEKIGHVDTEWSPQFALTEAAMKQVEKEDRQWWGKREVKKPSEEVLRKELPSSKWSPAARAGLRGQITKFVSKIIP